MSTQSNKALFNDIANDVPISRSRSFYDAITFRFRHTITGAEMTATEWYIASDGAFVVELCEMMPDAPKPRSLAELCRAAMGQPQTT